MRLRLWAFVALIFPLFSVFFTSTVPAQAASCQFVLGFGVIHALIPQIVGNCLEDEQHNGTNGDGLQATTGSNGAGGLLVWRKLDNWTAYTDGYHTWVNGPCGLEERLNTQRFPWEGDAASFPQLSDGCHAPVPPPPQPSVQGLPMMVPILSSSIASYFNQVAGSNDIAAVPSNQESLADSVTSGRRMVFFASAADLEANLSSLGNVPIIGYDPEHWPRTPYSEQSNLVATVAQASQAVHAAGHQFLLVPDDRFDSQYAAQLAPYADIYIIQGQHFEGDVSSYVSWIGQLAGQIHQASPNTKVFAQVATGGASDAQLVAAIKSVTSDVDGLVVWVSPSGLGDLQSVVSGVRSNN
jgi:hypothetical protein